LSREPIQTSEPLRREISRLAIAALAINGLIGAGIFGLPSEAARLTGAFSPVMFLICGLLMSAIVLSFGQAASYFQGTGGPILYTQEAFGSLVGFQTGWVLYIGRATSVAANSNLFASYVANLVEGADRGPARVAVIFGICAGFTALNIVGVRQGVGSVMAITVLKLLPLAIFIVVGLSFVTPGAFAGAAVPSYANFGEAVLLLFYAFIGFEGALIPAGEARNPRRDIPRALFLSAGVTAALYFLIQTVSVAVLPDLATAQRPLAAAAGVMMGPAGATLITIGAIVSILGNTASSMVTAPRMTYALARDRGLPPLFAAVHERYRTPHWSIVIYGTLSFALAVSGTFSWLAGMSSLARILGYGACVAALPRLQRKFGMSEHALRLPGGFAIPAIALVICAWLLTQVQLDALLVTAGFLFAGALLFAHGRRGRARGGGPDMPREPGGA
jgi:amino acid transporter